MIQIALVKWGRKYGPRYIHGLVDAIRRHTSQDLRVVCITDDPTGLREDIVTRPFPNLGLPLETMISFGGCLPKLSVFADGVLEAGLPTIYLDIDTGIFGDIAELGALLDKHPCLHALPNHFVPHWRTPWLSWMTHSGCYFVNSSIMVFYPENHKDIYTDFLVDFRKSYRPGVQRKALPRELRSDERFISQHEKGKLRALPMQLAGSFKRLYMGLLGACADRFPFLMRHRARVALTFTGDALKPELMAQFKPNQLVRVGRTSIPWRHPQFTRYWADILDSGPERFSP